jgi:uncharacterized membrane protein YtjA (UPF0391 family)
VKPLSLVVPNQGGFMLRIAIGFFILGLMAILLGANGIAGISLEIGKNLLFVFLVLAIISFIASMVTGRKMINRH